MIEKFVGQERTLDRTPKVYLEETPVDPGVVLRAQPESPAGEESLPASRVSSSALLGEDLGVRTPFRFAYTTLIPQYS